jgi:hypothetical protein
MCRSIKVLRVPEKTATTEEMRAAALQFVRKISGFHKPSKPNQEPFDLAVTEVAEAADRLLRALGPSTRRTQPPASTVETSSDAVL